MSPYYSKDGITIWHGDCREILPGLPKVDLVLTDPPYGMNYESNHYKRNNPFGGIMGDTDYPVDILQACMGLATGAVLAFCRWDNLAELPPPKSFLVWVKNNWTAGDLNHEYARQWEGVAFYPLAEHAFANGRPADVLRSDRVSPGRLNHPTEKPLPLISELLVAHKGNTILDPFMGSGTTLVAARDLGRKAIGIEIEERYCEIAAKRLSQNLLPFGAA